MKKYIKPELLNEEVIIEDVIAASGVQQSSYGDLIADKQDTFGSGFWDIFN